MTCIIIDDEASSRETIKSILSNDCPELKVLAEAENVEGAYNAILLHKPNLVFLDI